MAPRMHEGELDVHVALVRRLLAAQFPEWAPLPIARVPSSGTVNAIYRLGSDMAVRVPRVAEWARDLEKEQRWLPELAPHLPLAVPEPLAQGRPGEGYPWNWAVYRWLEGEEWAGDRVRDLCEAAVDLAQFISALQRIDATDGPSDQPADRGRPLAERDVAVRAAIAASHGLIDIGAATAAWDAALAAPVWNGPPVWIHGDLLPGNVLVARGRLSAVIDFGALSVGDPACELMAGWTLFSGRSRDVFREALSADEATWARARGWALSVAVIALPYYQDTNPVFAANARHWIAEVLADHASAQ
jgi:aminoglycoside phosphotransferase (APT) family kinase protein